MSVIDFLKRKNIALSVTRWDIDALDPMIQGLCASLLIGIIISTLGDQFGLQIPAAMGNSPEPAILIAYTLKYPLLALFSLITVGGVLSRAGVPPAQFFIAFISAVICTLQMNGSALVSGRGIWGFIGQIGIYTSGINDMVSREKTAFISIPLRKTSWIQAGDLKICFMTNHSGK